MKSFWRDGIYRRPPAALNRARRVSLVTRELCFSPPLQGTRLHVECVFSFVHMKLGFPHSSIWRGTEADDTTATPQRNDSTAASRVFCHLPDRLSIFGTRINGEKRGESGQGNAVEAEREHEKTGEKRAREKKKRKPDCSSPYICGCRRRRRNRHSSIEL